MIGNTNTSQNKQLGNYGTFGYTNAFTAPSDGFIGIMTGGTWTTLTPGTWEVSLFINNSQVARTNGKYQTGDNPPYMALGAFPVKKGDNVSVACPASFAGHITVQYRYYE